MELTLNSKKIGSRPYYDLVGPIYKVNPIDGSPSISN